MRAPVSSAQWMLECVIQFNVYYHILFAYFLNYSQFKWHSGSSVVNKDLIWSDVIWYMICCSKYVTSASTLTQVATGSVQTHMLLFCEHLKNHFYKFHHSWQVRSLLFFFVKFVMLVCITSIHSIQSVYRDVLRYCIMYESGRQRSAAFRPYI